MKIQEGDYVDVSGMNEAERREVVQALLDCGVDVGEGFDFCDSLSMKTICVDKDGIFHDFGRSFKGRKLTLSDLRSPEWDGNGLPPVGVECELYRKTDNSWLKGNVIGHDVDEYSDNKELMAVAWIPSLGEYLGFSKFRPIKTESQREREELEEVVRSSYYQKIGAENEISKITDALIKAGYKKVTK